MPVYVYRAPDGSEVEIAAQTYEPDRYKPEGYVLVIQTSTLVFGNFEVGDDDFSRRYVLNGKDQLGKSNGTQGKTNVNAVLRKWGPKGKPLEARTDIDPTKITKDGKRPPGVTSSLEAPPELASSSARGVSTSEIGR